MVESVALGGAGEEILDHHVGGVGQTACNGNPVRLLEVDRDRPFGAVDLQVVDALVAGERRAPLAAAVAAAGSLDLDHVGTQVAQHHRAVRPRQDLAQVEYADPVEREWAAVHGRRSACELGQLGQSPVFVGVWL